MKIHLHRSQILVLEALLPWFGVSRMKRMDSPFQCCIKDGSRSTAYALQKEFANHLKVLCSKDMVLSVQAKGAIKGIR